MSLSEITPFHAEAAAALHATSFEKPWSIDEFKGLLSLKTTKGWIDETGLLLISKVLDEIEILTILTHPDARGKGRATAFLNQLISYAKKEAVQKIFLEVNEENLSAIKLYEKVGFQKTGIRKNYYKMKDGSFKDAFLYTHQLGR